MLHSPKVQTWLVKSFVENIRESTGVKMEIGGVDFRPMKSLILNDVLLRDFRNDTLLFCKKAEMKIDTFALAARKVHIKEVTLTNADFNLWIRRGEHDSELNLSVFLDSLFSGEEKKTSAGKNNEWKVGLEKIRIRHSRFVYKEEDYEPVDYGINWNDVECTDVNADIVNPDFFGEEVRMQVARLSLRERSGFELKRLDGFLTIKQKELTIRHIKIVTEKSEGNLSKLEYKWEPGRRDWRYFTSQIQQLYEVEDSRISFEDLAYFNANLLGITHVLACKGVVSNTVNRIEGKNLQLGFGERSVLKADFKSYGLPNFRTALFEIDIKNSSLYPEDLEALALPGMEQPLNIPAPLRQLGVFSLAGKVKGTPDNFELQLSSSTEGLQGDILFAYTSEKEREAGPARFSGKLDLSAVDMGRMTQTPLLGNARLSANYSGKLGNAPSLDARIRMPFLEVYGKVVRNTSLSLNYKRDRFNVISASKDRNLNLQLGAGAEFKDSATLIRANGQLRVADLNYFDLGLLKNEGRERVGLEFTFSGKSDETQAGELIVSDLTYAVARDSFAIAEALLRMEENRGYYKTSLVSDIADVEIEGRGVLHSSLDYLNRQLKEFFPVYNTHTTGAEPDSAINTTTGRYRMHNKDMNRVLKVLYPKLSLSKNARLESYVDGEKAKMHFRLTADSVKYGATGLLAPKINIEGEHDRLLVRSSVGTLQFGEVCNIYNLQNELQLHNKEIDGKLFWSNWGERTYSGDISAKVKFIPHAGAYRTKIDINPGIIIMGDSIWNLRKSTLFIEKGYIDIRRFALDNDEQHMAVSGKISDDFDGQFSVKLEKLDLSKLNKMLFNSDLNIFGIVNGEVHFKEKMVHSDIYIHNWGMGKDTIGTLQMNSFWDPEQSRVLINAENRMGDSIPFRIAGHYTPSSDNIDLSIRLKELNLKELRQYASSPLYKDESGKLSGDIRATGKITDPELHGYLSLDSGAFTITDLNTPFYVNDSIYFEGDKILLKTLTIRDIHNNKALLDGYYNRQNGQYKFDLNSNNFLIMNTGPEHNDLLHGKVYLSSFIHLSGSGDVRNITIKATPESGSQLFLPISSAAAGDKNNFLHFVQPEGSRTRERRKNLLNTKDLLLNANLELNDNLRIQIVFDPLIGDLLQTSGNGNVKIELGHDGALNIFGDYNLSGGHYALTLGGLLNKSFALKPGGNIVWNGSPYDATIDIDAVYSLKTSLNELLENTNTDTDRGTKVPVECILSLNNNISNPTVAFDINFPSLDAQTKSYVQSLFSSQDEKNKQMFSLLMLNRFYKPDYVTSTEAEERNVGYQAGMTTASELLSNQLSRWLSGIDNKFDIGVAYRPGNEITTDEVELALSTQLLNDRINLSINGNMDVGNAKSANPNSSNNVVGDFDLEFKLNRTGTLKLKAYSHTDEKIIYKNNNETTQGIGVSYQETFDTLRELLRKYTTLFRKKKKTDETNPE